MNEKYRMAFVGALTGFAVSLGLALPNIVPPTMADEQPVKSLYDARAALVDFIAPDAPAPNFVKPNFELEAGVSTEVLSSTVIRKIEAGRTSFVTIATTSTGVYSSDALESPHIRYPGMHQGPLKPAAGRVSLFSNGEWAVHRPLDAGSFVEIVPFPGGQYVVDGEGACAFVGQSAYC